MALVQKKLSAAKQIKLIIVLVIVIVITLLVAYFGLWRKPSTEEVYYAPDQAQEILIPDVLPKKSGFEQIQGLTESSIFIKLKQFGAWPLSLDPKGRPQPFIEKKAEQ